jgi:hypothetical protein
MAAAPAMEAVAALAVMPVGAVLRRLRLTAGDEGWQAADVAAALRRLLLRLALLVLRPPVLRLSVRLRPAVGLWLLLRLLLAELRLLLRLLLILRLLLMLRLLLVLLLLMLRLLLILRLLLMLLLLMLRLLLLLVRIAAIFHRPLDPLLGGGRLRLVVRVLLTELFLSGSDQAEIVLGVLVVRFSGNMIAA